MRSTSALKIRTNKWAQALVASATALLLATSSLLAAQTAAHAEEPGDAPVSLTVEGMPAPTDLEGLDGLKLGWQVGTPSQSAYRVIVASSEAKADESEGDLWDSGKIESTQQDGVLYAGGALSPAKRYYWKVQTWDGEDTKSAWSDITHFGTGPGSDWSSSEPIWTEGKFANWADYTFESTFSVTGVAATVTVRNSSVADQKFYMFQIRSAEAATEPNTLKIHKGLTATPIIAVDLGQFDLNIANGTEHILKIKAAGSTLTTWIDGVEVHSDSNFTDFASGGIGFRTGSSESATFDNLKVTDQAGAVLYSNDFSDGTNNDFQGLSVSNGKLVVGASKNVFLAGSWANYTLSTKLTVKEVATGVVFRASDSGNSYMWQFRGTDNQLKTHKQVAGNYTALATVNLPAGTLDIDKQVDVRIQAIGSTIKTWIDDVLVDTTTDTTFQRGAVGFRNGSTESGSFKDLQVTSESGAGTLLSTTFAAGDGAFTCGTIANNTLTLSRGSTCLVAGLSNAWALLRGDVDVQDKPIAWATLFATGSSPSPAKQYVYKASVNGEYVGLGPTQSISGETRYDGFDVTSLIQPGQQNTVSAIAYTTSNQKFQAELLIKYRDGSEQVFGTGSDWKAKSGEAVFPSVGSIGTSYFVAPKENFNAQAYPYGFDKPGFDDSSWSAALVKSRIGTLAAAPMQKVQEQLQDATTIVDKGDGNYFIDFGRTWVGGIKLDLESGSDGQKVDVRFGEVTSAPNTVKYALSTSNNYQDIYTLKNGAQSIQTWGMRVFRYVEILGSPEPITTENLKALALVYPFDESASTFTSSSSELEQVYQLSKNTIESLNVNFYTDSWTRERTNYEADGYLQLLSTLYLVDDLSLGRYSMNYFAGNRTWPTEWPIYVILAVHDAWRQTGDTAQLKSYYENLQQKLPDEWFEEDTNLIRKTSGSNGNQGTDADIVDWPTSERDGYSFQQYNTVINSISYRAYRDMAAIAAELGKTEDAASYTARADSLRTAINDAFYDSTTGNYDDGMNASKTLTGHKSLHASVFALAFGVVEEDQQAKVADYIESRGMACSVYCAAFLIKALYDGGDGQAALDLLTSTGTKSWMNMINVGAGATMEAWDISLKSNLTYSHPWAASPAFNVPSGLFGVQPIEAGYASFQIKPQPGDLEYGTVTVPTVKGTIGVAFNHSEQGSLQLGALIPNNTSATISLPAVQPGPGDDAVLYIDGKATPAEYTSGYLLVENIAPGCHTVSTEQGTLAAQDEQLISVCGTAAVPETPTEDAPSAITLPAVKGKAIVGQTLAASAGTWNQSGLKFSYRWLRNGKAITGATSSRYLVKAADVGKTLRVQITATKGNLSPVRASSATTTKVKKAASRISVAVSKKTVKAGKSTRITVKVSASKLTAKGKVAVYYRGKKVKTLTLVRGKASYTLKTKGSGRQPVRFVYQGSSEMLKSTKTVKVNVKR